MKISHTHNEGRYRESIWESYRHEFKVLEKERGKESLPTSWILIRLIYVFFFPERRKEFFLSAMAPENVEREAKEEPRRWRDICTLGFKVGPLFSLGSVWKKGKKLYKIDLMLNYLFKLDPI